MNNYALTNYAKLFSGGTVGNVVLSTDKKFVDNELIQDFYRKFPQIEHISRISIHSKTKKEMGLHLQYDFKAEWHVDNTLNWNRK